MQLCIEHRRFYINLLIIFFAFALADDLPGDNMDNKTSTLTVGHFDTHLTETITRSYPIPNILERHKLNAEEASKPTKPAADQEAKAYYQDKSLYPPLNPGMPNPSKPEFNYSNEDYLHNDGTTISREDDQHNFVALLE